MRWHCAREHFEVTTWLPRPRPKNFDSFGAWAFDQVFHHYDLVTWLVCRGFIDGEGEGQDAFWRWDFWNAHMARVIAEQEHAEWEMKRRSAIARWGEGGG